MNVNPLGQPLLTICREPEPRMPTVHDVAGYVLSEYDAAMIAGIRLGLGQPGNAVCGGMVFPALMVGRWSRRTANLRVALDGDDFYWPTSRTRGREPGHWFLEDDPA